MTVSLLAKETLNQLLAAAWSPASLPETELVPWSELLPLVQASNLGSLVFSLARDMKPAPPTTVLRSLEQEYFRSIISNTRILHQLSQVHAILSTTGAPLLLLKGAAMTQTLYRDPILRLIGDIDVVVPMNYVSTCREALMSQGYLPTSIDHQHGIPFDHTNEEAFIPPSRGQVYVELHWHVLDVPFYMKHIPVNWFWQNTHEMNIAGKPFFVLNPEANLVYLPAHLALHHQFTSLHSLLDLALLVVKNQGSLDWAKVVSAVHQFQLVSVLKATVARLAETWPDLPLWELQRLLASEKPTKNDERLYQLLISTERDHNLDFYTTLKSLHGLRSRLRYAWRNMFPQPAYMIGRYAVKARWQLPFYYVYRLANGLLRFLIMLPRARKISRREPEI